MQTVTFENFRKYLNSLGINDAEIRTIEIAETGATAVLKNKPAESVSKRFSQMGVFNNGKGFDFVRLGSADFLNWDITQGFFGFDTAAILAKGRANLRSGKYKGALRY